MRQHNAYTLNDWPRRKNGELIFQNTNEAFYYANIVDDRVAAYHFLEKWRKNTLQDIDALKKREQRNWNRLFDLAARAQFYRECMEEIRRINEGKK